MKKTLFAPLAAATFAAFAMPAAAQDAAAGEKEYRKCAACHAIVAPDGTVVQRGGKTGPNLYGIVGRQAGSEEGFRYKASLVALGESGFVWDEASIAEYVVDPAGFLKAKLNDPSASSGMAKQNLKNPADVAAFLATHGG